MKSTSTPAHQASGQRGQEPVLAAVVSAQGAYRDRFFRCFLYADRQHRMWAAFDENGPAVGDERSGGLLETAPGSGGSDTSRRRSSSPVSIGTPVMVEYSAMSEVRGVIGASAARMSSRISSTWGECEA